MQSILRNQEPFHNNNNNNNNNTQPTTNNNNNNNNHVKIIETLQTAQQQNTAQTS